MERIGSSFRDPSGYVYKENGTIYREVSEEYQPILTKLTSSGLNQKLLKEGLLLPFEWRDNTIIPEQIPFISYPYEWSFSMLKDAALVTLRTQILALQYGMTLKDASAYNIQFVSGRPVLIDHLSFYPYKEGEPWVAYRQFCQHFLNPLALAAYKGTELLQLTKLYMDGIPADLTSRLLQFRYRFNLGLLMHVKLNSLKTKVTKVPRMSELKLKAVVGNLESTIKHLNWKSSYGWKDYSKECNYSTTSADIKVARVREYLTLVDSKVVADLGSNTGKYTRVALNQGCRVVAIDSDPTCIDLLYKSNRGNCCNPLVEDLMNPSPSIGWEGTERDSLISRLKVDTVMALALVHHLAIGNNVPLDRISSFLASLCKFLIIEFVPKEDNKVQELLKFREDIYTNYTRKGFEEAFEKNFNLRRSEKLEGSERYLYLMEGR